MQYLYGILLALKYYQLLRKDPETFVPRYLAMMRNGFDDTPERLLRKFLQVDLHDPALVSDALTLPREKITELEALYAKEAPGRAERSERP